MNYFDYGHSKGQCLALPNDLSKEIMVVLLQAHLQNFTDPEKDSDTMPEMP